MSEFQKGDVIRRKADAGRYGDVSPGQEYIVSADNKGASDVRLEGQPDSFCASKFELVKRCGQPLAAPAPVGQANQLPPNPKKLYGDKKPPVHLIHPIAELHESAALRSGANKYGENNYIETPVEAMTYVGAIKRHLSQWLSGERVDAKELVHHLGAIKACCTILLTAEACNTLIDNRPGAVTDGPTPTPATRETYQAATEATFAEVTAVCEHLNVLYPAKLA